MKGQSAVDDVARFPPLPPILSPTGTEPDQRQTTSQHVIAALVDHLVQNDYTSSTATMAYGFRASAVDLGALQKLLGEGLGRFSMDQVRQRWDDDVLRWVCAGIRTWVQRCKEMHFELADNGIHISLQTQDDHGYYQYEFDVFPGKRATRLNKKRSKKSG
jgi:hypothetical protein